MDNRDMTANDGIAKGVLRSGSSNSRQGRKLVSSKDLLKPISLDDAIKDGSPPPILSFNDKVVWLSDSGPEYGVVKWLGKLPDVGTDWMAGVEFVNPVGSGTGLYNDLQLFEAPMNHASLVPVIGLIKSDDFLGSTAESPLKPRRAKKREDVKNDGKPLASPVSSMISSQPNSYPHDVVDASNFITKLNNKEFQDGYKHKINSNINKNDLMAFNSNNTLGDSKYIEPVMSDSHLEKFLPEVLNGTNTYELEIGSVVEVTIEGVPRYGVIRWVGQIDQVDDKIIAGIELEEECVGASDGIFNGKKYFDCAAKKGYFVLLNQCKRDSRFSYGSDRRRSALFGSIDCPSVTGDVPPLSSTEDLLALCGKNRGIQGHHNSCYLDATLFAMFTCTTIFESLLHRPPSTNDILEYCEVQRVLKEEIVNPLRANLYVRADRVMQLRTLLEKLSSVRGLTSEEKDPEEFLNLLLNEILKADPYLQLSSGLESFFYQLIVEKDEKLALPTVQQLFDQSFLGSDIKLREVPPCLLIQMPRFGRQFKMYPRIIPSLYLDITDVLENSPRQCSVCGLVAEFECKECFGQFGEGLDSTAFCKKCLDKIHSHKKRSKHKSVKLMVPSEFNMLKEQTQVPRIYMELFAVLCIETSHYVSFVKCGSGPDAPWCFFDSMADRKGEQNGYNIPEVVSFPDLRWWLSEEGTAFLLTTKDDKVLPEMARRLLCDAYLCFYQSPDMMLYR